MISHATHLYFSLPGIPGVDAENTGIQRLDYAVHVASLASHLYLCRSLSLAHITLALGFRHFAR